MTMIQAAPPYPKPRRSTPLLLSLLSLPLLFVAWPQNLPASQENQAPAQSSQGVPYAPQSPDQLQQLVAPIALYPDSLVAQILAASAFPEQIVEADRWVQSHPDLKGDALGQEVDQQPWDPSVKALAAFPSVLGNMDKNLSWTSSLGDAYYNQEQDVMDAVQVMRQRAEQAGTLKSTPQQTVTDQDSTISVQPADPQVVYVPAYDPWLVYGGPIVAWPGWYPYPGIWYGGPYLSFGVGFGIGFYGGYGWGWNRWGFDWRNHYATYNHGRYYSQSRTFYNRNTYYRGGGGGSRGGGGFNSARNGGARSGSGNTRGFNSSARGGVYNHPGASPKPFEGNTRAARGYAPTGGQRGVHSGAYSNYDHGGETRSYSSRGNASLNHGGSPGGGSRGSGGGGSSHGGGGGGASHGGGGGHPH
ncbi:MAG TPA: DUF3300 domain-containing protein [Candidatus Sulfotelmatobacter sp.]|jgi:hypothetical protein|nr:DUF3300 domain-containing protein [Candidatus Sulfotelmatobacter sp.]